MFARALLLAAGLGALAVLAAGCGGGSSPGVASLGPAVSTTQAPGGGAQASQASKGTAMVPYIDCMQRHGVPIQSSGGGGAVKIGADGKSAEFVAANKACQKLLPLSKALSPAQQAENQRQLLELAACIRSHGYPSFPDPSSQGVLNLTSVSGANPNSSQFRAAMQRCGRGRGEIRIAINGPG